MLRAIKTRQACHVRLVAILLDDVMLALVVGVLYGGGR
jgi:hypothetical protein